VTIPKPGVTTAVGPSGVQVALDPEPEAGLV